MDINKLRSKKNRILNNYCLNQRLNQQHTEFIKQLLSYKFSKNYINDILNIYVQEKCKNGRSIKYFQVQMRSGQLNDIDFEDVLQKVKNPNFNINIKRKNLALRNAVKNQIIDFKKCNNSNLNVDHLIPFQTLVNNFLMQNNLTYNSLDYYYDEVLDEYRLKDGSIEDEFAQFHQQNAQLQLLTTEENLKKVASDKS